MMNMKILECLMKRLIICWLMLGFLAPGHFVTTGRGADADEEARLLAVVQSDASLRDKDAACARLKYIGTARSVPALAGLLNNRRLLPPAAAQE